MVSHPSGKTGISQRPRRSPYGPSAPLREAGTTLVLLGNQQEKERFGCDECYVETQQGPVRENKWTGGQGYQGVQAGLLEATASKGRHG